MKRPNIKAQAYKIQKWIDNELEPYLQGLLDTAQRKTRHRIVYRDSMGMRYLDFHADEVGYYVRVHDRVQEVWGRNEEDHILFRRFPELLEFSILIDQLSEHLFQCIGHDIEPSVQPLNRKRA